MAFIYNLSDTWNDAATTWNGIKLAVTNTSSSASSNLLNLTVTGATTASFVVDKSGNLVLNGSVNKITMTAPATGATLTLADGSSFITSGAYSTTFTTTGTTTLTLPTSGTVTALGNSTTGSGSIVLDTSPTLVTPALGTPSSGNLTNCTGYQFSNLSGTVSIANGGTGQTTANAAFNALAPSQTGNNGKYLTTDGTNTSWATNPLGTVTSVDVSGGTTGLSFSGGPITTSGTITMAGTLAAANGGTGLTSLGSGVATWLGTPSSANLASAVTDETGSGSLVFGTSPTIGSPTITGTATFNGSTSGTVAFKAPAIAGTTTFTLPSGNGTSGYVLVTDGLGNTSWASSGGAAGNAAGVDKNVQFNDAGIMAGNAAFNFDKATASLSLGTASVTTGKLAFYNGATANATTIQAGSASAAVTYTLPTADGTNGQALITNGSGALSWTTVASGLAVGTTAITGGTSGRILYDNGNVLGEKAVTGTGDVVLATSPTLVTPILGTPQSGTLSSCTGLPISTGVSGLGANVATFLATPSSANLAAAVTNETGSGALVFGTSPTFTTSALFPAGSVSAPGIAASGDTNTGIYFPAADNVALATNGTAALTVDSNQNVSITGVIDGLSTPGVATGTGSSSGGTLAAATYYVRIVAFDSAGNTTNAGTESTGVTTTGSTSSIAYTWTAVTGATGYRVYFSTTSGTYASGYFVTTSASYTLTTTSGSFAVGLPASNTTGISLMSNQSFKRNRIINGDMRVDQRAAGTVTPTAGGYRVDRWETTAPAASKYSVQQSSTAPTGFVNSLLITSLSAYTVGASEGFLIQQQVEGLNIADLNWGSANAQTVTISFWVRSSLTGTFGGALRNSDNSRSYPFSYTIIAANTWEQKSVTIAGDTSGTWLTTNGSGIKAAFSFGSGATISGTAGSWASANYQSATGATSVVGTNGATFYITGVQLEVGSIATPYERQIYSEQLAQCQRYYQYLNRGLSGGVESGSQIALAGICVVPMRSSPTIALLQTTPQITSGGTNFSGSSSAIDDSNINFDSYQIRINGFTGLTLGRAAVVRNGAGGGLISLSSEL